MANAPVGGLFSGKFHSLYTAEKVTAFFYGRKARWKWLPLAAAILLSPLVFAQSSPVVTAVDPASGKVNDTVTLAGENLGKGSVTAVYLSDDKDDYKAAIVDQSDQKIVMKIPQVKSGDYNISIQVGDKIFIKPVKFKVEE